MVAVNNIPHIYCLENLTKVILFVFGFLKLGYSRESSVNAVFLKDFGLFPANCFIVFREAEWVNADFPATATEFGYDVFGKKLGIGTGHVDFGILHVYIRVQNVLKIFNELNLIKQYVILVLVSHKTVNVV